MYTFIYQELKELERFKEIFVRLFTPEKSPTIPAGVCGIHVLCNKD